MVSSAPLHNGLTRWRERSAREGISRLCTSVNASHKISYPNVVFSRQIPASVSSINNAAGFDQ